MHQKNVVVVGPQSSGKSTLLNYLATAQYNPYWRLSYPHELYKRDVYLLFSSNTDSYRFKVNMSYVDLEDINQCSDVDAVIYVYDSSNFASVEQMKKDVVFMNEHNWVFVVVAAKSDAQVMQSQWTVREVRKETGVELDGALFSFSALHGDAYLPFFESLVFQFEGIYTPLTEVLLDFNCHHHHDHHHDHHYHDHSSVSEGSKTSGSSESSEIDSQATFE